MERIDGSHQVTDHDRHKLAIDTPDNENAGQSLFRDFGVALTESINLEAMTLQPC